MPWLNALGVLLLTLATSSPALSQVGPLLTAQAGRDWKWPSPTIAVCWENLVSRGHARHADQEARRAWVQEAVTANWERYSNLRFRGWGACRPDSAGIRIEILWDSETTSSSYVGYGAMNGTQRGMSLQLGSDLWRVFNCVDLKACVQMAALHEFGHALGFHHEHRRKDAEGRLQSDFICQQLHPPKEGDPDIPREQQNLLSEEYDPDSIMNYCPIFGQWRTRLSEGDVRGVQRAYGDGGKPLYKAARWAGRASCEKKYPAQGAWGRAFLHVLTGECHQCPAGFDRTVNPDVKAPTACQEGLQFRTARLVGRAGCPSGAFQHLTLDQCYTCGEGYARTLVNDPKHLADLTKVPRACVRKDF